MKARQANKSLSFYLYTVRHYFYLLNYLMCWNYRSIAYSEIYKIFVKDSLDVANRKDKSFSQDVIDAEDVSGGYVALDDCSYIKD